ncbi:putative GTP cyclohydrolase-2 [Erysiphe neolycopersici]|uniref:GTP cyclohydrolase II n=1 Tax=Erysiphe neolycopersici TaxID=212602 RepID=A0A420HYE8_9PEZI|nr:putative GTP cyclohydrolase-2 [Erysiphe neolycopersici]
MPEFTAFDAPDFIESDDEALQLPSFYSPRPGPASRTNSQLDINFGEPKNQLSSIHYNLDDAGHNSFGELEIDNCSSDLLSPTIGSPSPKKLVTSAIDYSLPEPNSINGANINGSCGQKRPKLLSKLPDVKCVVRARIPTTIGSTGTDMFLHLYQNSEDSKEHLAIVFGNSIRSRSLDRVREGETEMDRLIRGAYVGRLYPGRTTSDVPGEAKDLNKHEGKKESPLVRIHSECYTGETVWSARCDCGEQLDEAARLMSVPTNDNPHPSGVIIYLRQEGRGIGLGEKLKAYNLQDLGSDTVEANLLLRHPADARSYGLATAMLLDLGISHVRLLTNNPEKIRAIEGPNREIVVSERVPMIPLAWRKGEVGGIRSQEVGGYLQTKIKKMGHMLSMEEE